MLDEMTLTIPNRGQFVLRLDTGDTTYRATILEVNDAGEMEVTRIRTSWRETPVEAYAAAVRRLLQPVDPQTNRRRRKDTGAVRLSLTLRGGR